MVQKQQNAPVQLLQRLLVCKLHVGKVNTINLFNPSICKKANKEKLQYPRFTSNLKFIETLGANQLPSSIAQALNITQYIDNLAQPTKNHQRTKTQPKTTKLLSKHEINTHKRPTSIIRLRDSRIGHLGCRHDTELLPSA
ncbi:unnamed protein product [Rhodiola kirilowii]